MTTKAEPTKQEMIDALSTRIEVRALEVELQRLNTALAAERVKELEALAQMSQFQSPNPADNPNLVQHVVTQNDLDTIPEFKAQGFEVGQTVGIPKEVYGVLYPEDGPVTGAPAMHTV